MKPLDFDLSADCTPERYVADRVASIRAKLLSLYVEALYADDLDRQLGVYELALRIPTLELCDELLRLDEAYFDLEDVPEPTGEELARGRKALEDAIRRLDHENQRGE